MVARDVSVVQANLWRYGRGIFMVPSRSPQDSSGRIPSSAASELPSRMVAKELLQHYHNTVHAAFPIIHWPHFTQRLDSVYREGSLQAVPRSSAALLFAVFAFGALHRTVREGLKYLEVSKTLMDIWAEDFDLDHARCAFLCSAFLIESNLKAAGWSWLGIAVRISQHLGLYTEFGDFSALEQEMRRRVWWSLYAYDR